MSLLRRTNIYYESHVTRFAYNLVLQAPFLEKRLVNNNVTVVFKDAIDEIIHKSSIEPNAFLRSINVVVSPICDEMSKVRNTFNTHFGDNSQISSVPIELLTLISVLIDGVDISNKTFSQSAVTCSQQIMYNFQKNKRKKSVQSTRHFKYRETPAVTYVSVKIFSILRSKTLIEHFFMLGICIPYSRILDITKNIADCILQQYERDKVFLPEMLRELLFTIIAKDNVDLNSSSNTAAGHHHGTSMTALQFPLSTRPGKIRNIEYELTVGKTLSKKVDKLPQSYTNAIQLNMSKAPVCLLQYVDIIFQSLNQIL